MKCSVCAFENDSHVSVCAQCGTALTPSAQVVFCGHCGKQNRPTAKYCVSCGSQQVMRPAQAAQPPQQPISQSPAPAQTIFASAPPSVPFHVPAYRLPTLRGFWKMLLLGILTGMIYPLVIMSRISMEINMVASRHDGKRTMHFLWMPFVGVLTLGVYFFVWIHQLCNRIGNELRRRQISYDFRNSSFWVWNFLWGIIGSLITSAVTLALLELHLVGYELAAIIASVGAIISSIGPCIFVAKLMRAMNLMNADYNEKG